MIYSKHDDISIDSLVFVVVILRDYPQFAQKSRRVVCFFSHFFAADGIRGRARGGVVIP
ncbi:hypothetical protein D805_0869 [Bifidobacterium thermophilum RBL67]|uniref:Uncharacterized protein n=1 Tax=Bifidobacterium thermophilum RBL67 TaxID=1254439 RepID=M4RCB8_9BIFI|nr:hypothetical protein D805_0869 [Bifidobacterium thermophilum RBL67]